jgi:6-phosphogluconate dehydrogenase
LSIAAFDPAMGDQPAEILKSRCLIRRQGILDRIERVVDLRFNQAALLAQRLFAGIVVDVDEEMKRHLQPAGHAAHLAEGVLRADNEKEPAAALAME